MYVALYPTSLLVGQFTSIVFCFVCPAAQLLVMVELTNARIVSFIESMYLFLCVITLASSKILAASII